METECSREGCRYDGHWRVECRIGLEKYEIPVCSFHKNHVRSESEE